MPSRSATLQFGLTMELKYLANGENRIGKASWTPPEEAATKVCRRCHREKPLDEFGNLQSTRDGKHKVCRECLRRARMLHERREG